MHLRHLMESESEELPQGLIISNNGDGCRLLHSFTHDGIHYAIYTYDHGFHIMGGFFLPSEGVGGRMVQDYSTFKVLDYTNSGPFSEQRSKFVNEFQQNIYKNKLFLRTNLDIQVEVA